jgi:hypothetical protein
MAAALLFLLSGIGVLASDRLRVIATGRVLGRASF